jgi:hypothetical protein
MLACLNAGCASRSEAVAARPTANLLRIQMDPEFQRMATHFQEGRYREAQALLQAMDARPDLSPEERAFLKRQADICDGRLAPNRSQAATPVPSTPAKPSVPADCGPRALALVCRQLGIVADLAQIRKDAGTTAKGTSLAGLERAAKKLGLSARGVQVDRAGLLTITPPAIAWMDGNHFVAVRNVQTAPLSSEATVTIHDPSVGKDEEVPASDLLARSGGILLLVSHVEAVTTHR